MKKIVLVSDSFKGSLSSIDICDIATSEAVKVFPECEVVTIPVADGGEGTVDCFLKAVDGEKVFCNVKNPFMEDMSSFYALINNGKTAIIEVASVIGLPLVEDRKNAMLTTTYGVGELVLDALDKNVDEIIIGLGGSCTNDMGLGMLSVLGCEFFDTDGVAFTPIGGGSLLDVCSLSMDKLDPRLKTTKITCMCDVDNPPYGENGAAFVFAPQKSTNQDDVPILDNCIMRICDLIKSTFNTDLSTLVGGGAAGALGAGLHFFLNAELKRGIDVVLDTVDFEGKSQNADLVISGEGKIDSQSLQGKVISGVANRTSKMDIPLVLLVGAIGDNIDQAFDMGVTSVFSILSSLTDWEGAKKTSKASYKFTINQLFRTIKAMR